MKIYNCYVFLQRSQKGCLQVAEIIPIEPRTGNAV